VSRAFRFRHRVDDSAAAVNVNLIRPEPLLE
jgi:hypothetical protein